MSVTLNDIAMRAGCSAATVSRALNGTAGVDPKLLSRIRSAVQTLEEPAPEAPLADPARAPRAPGDTRERPPHTPSADALGCARRGRRGARFKELISLP